MLRSFSKACFSICKQQTPTFTQTRSSGITFPSKHFGSQFFQIRRSLRYIHTAEQRTKNKNAFDMLLETDERARSRLQRYEEQEKRLSARDEEDRRERYNTAKNKVVETAIMGFAAFFMVWLYDFQQGCVSHEVDVQRFVAKSEDDPNKDVTCCVVRVTVTNTSLLSQIVWKDISWECLRVNRISMIKGSAAPKAQPYHKQTKQLDMVIRPGESRTLEQRIAFFHDKHKYDENQFPHELFATIRFGRNLGFQEHVKKYEIGGYFVPEEVPQKTRLILEKRHSRRSEISLPANPF